MKKLALVALLLLVACTDGGGSSESTGSADSSTTDDASDPTAVVVDDDPDGTTSTSVLAEDDLPRLEDVAAPEDVDDTRTDELLTKLDAAEPTVQDAIDAWAIYDPDMPGASPTDLPPGDGLGGAATVAMLQAVRDQLAPEQLAVLEAFEDLPVAATISDGEVTILDESEPVAGTDATGGFAPRRATQSIVQRYAQLLKSTADRWSSYKPGLLEQWETIELRMSPVPVPEADKGMVTSRENATTCRVTVDPSFWKDDATDDKIAFWFAHELFHCAQFTWDTTLSAKTWITDGGADWAAMDLFRGLFSAEVDFTFPNWFTVGATPLSKRSYDAWALFEMLHDTSSVDMYAIHHDLNQAPNATSTEGLVEMAGMNGLLFRMAWTSRSVRSTEFDESWQLDWIGPSPNYGPRDNFLQYPTKGIGMYHVKYIGEFVHPQMRIPMANEVDVVSIQPVRDPITTVAASGTLVMPANQITRLCISPEKCKCPEGQTPSTIPMNSRFVVLSLPPREDVVKNQARNEKWDPKKFCEEKKPKDGSSYGDPHLVSFDGMAFEAQTLGEFVNSRDPEGGFEVQTRHVVAGAGAAATSVVALGTTGARATFEWTDFSLAAEVVVRVDGRVVEDSEFTFGDVSVERVGNEFVARWPDGSVVQLFGQPAWFVRVIPSDDRVGRLVGLLGAADGDLRNDLRLPDGTIVDTPATEGTESPYSLAWAVDEDTSLFDYDEGESPATFRIEHPIPEPENLEELGEAIAAICREMLPAEATEQELIWCTFDVGVTGDETYAETYDEVVVERVEEEGTVDVVDAEPEATTTLAPGTGAVGGEPTISLEGTLAAPYSAEVGGDVVAELRGTVEAESGTVLLARAEVCLAEQRLTLRVSDAEGASSFVFVCDPTRVGGGAADEDDELVNGEGYIWLPSGGTYEVTVESDQEAPAFVSVAIFADPTPTIVEEADVVGSSVTLDGVGDTIVYQLGRSANRYPVTGLDRACGVISYGAPALDEGAPWPLSSCVHTTGPVGPGDAGGPVIPLIVFARTDEPIDVAFAAP